MPYIIKPGSFKYKKSNGQFSEIDCFEGPDLTEEVAALEKGKAPIIIDSATGNPIAIKDGADGLPVEGMKIHFLPVQDLHGYGSPWLAGGGENILDPNIKFTAGTYFGGGVVSTQDGYNISLSGTPTESGNIATKNIPTADAIVMPAGTYTSVGAIFSTYKADGSWYTNRQVGTWTADEPFIVRQAYIQAVAGTPISGNRFIALVKGSTTPSAWTPYSNICPISGWTWLTAWRTGKNLYNKTQYPFTQYSRYNPSVCWTPPIFVKHGTYTFSCSSGFGTCYIPVYKTLEDANANANRLAQYNFSNASSTTITFDEDVYVRYQQNGTGGTDEDYAKVSQSWQTELGSTVSPYATYTGASYPITFPDGQTVYGGTLDAVTGVLSVEYKYITENGTGQWGEVLSGGNRWYIGGITTDAETLDTTGVCNIGKLVNAFDKTGVVVQSNGRINLCGDLYNAFNDVAELKTFLSENPLQLVYKLATPIVIPLDPITVQTLIGDNTIWSDANGQIDLEYRADTKLFCQKNDQVNDVQINGTSILDEHGVANIPPISSNGLGLARSSNSGVQCNSQGQIFTKKASSAEQKEGTNQYNVIVPYNQHESVFYGLAKLAGADMSSSSNAIGTFTPEAIVAIQKMLGIYQAPWELIREDTVTNAEEADIEITVDGNGLPFELTDVAIVFTTPNQETASSFGGTGNVRFYYDSTNYIASWNGGWTQAANANATGTYAIVENKGDLIQVISMQSSVSAVSNAKFNWAGGLEGYNMGIQIIHDFAVQKVVIRLITGTCYYKLYGRRKWTT